MDKVAEVEAEPVCIEAGRTRIRGPRGVIILRRFQEELLDFFSSSEAIAAYLYAPTGSGKTFTTILPLIARGGQGVGVLAVYPTRALVHDQAASVSSTLRYLGAKPLLENGPLRVYELGLKEPVELEKRIGLLTLTSDAVSELADRLFGQAKAPRRDILYKTVSELWAGGEPIDYIVAFAVPEYPYLLASRTYSNPYAAKILFLAAMGVVEQLASRVAEAGSEEELEQLRRKTREAIEPGRVYARRLLDVLASLGDIVFMDEFHVWSGFEKYTALALSMAYLVLRPYIGADFRLVFSSATPEEELVETIKCIAGGGVREIRAKPVQCNPGRHVIRGRTIIKLYPVNTRSAGPVSWLELDSKLKDIVKAFIGELEGVKRFIVFGRRASSVEEAAEAYYQYTGRKPVLVTGVRHPVFPGKEALIERREEGELPLFGNFAIEIGVDLKNIGYGIVVASTPGELIQRAGRIGRGETESRIVIPVPSHYYKYVVDEVVNSRDYVEVLEKIAGYMYHDLPVKKALEEIGGKRVGKLKAYIALSALVAPLLAADKLYDRATRDVFKIYLRVIDMLGLEPGLRDWMVKRVAKNTTTLINLASFRSTWVIEYERGTSQGSQEVVDKASLPTILSNYVVTRIDSTKPIRVAVDRPERKKAAIVLQVYGVRGRGSDEVKAITDAIVPAFLAKHALGVTRDIQDTQEEKILAEILDTNEPVYIAEPRKDLELLVAYGYGIRVENRNNQEPIAYIIPI